MVEDERSRTQWTRTPGPRVAAGIAPACPGVYVTGSVVRVRGLPVSASWRHVQATPSLLEAFRSLERLLAAPTDRRASADDQPGTTVRRSGEPAAARVQGAAR